MVDGSSRMKETTPPRTTTSPDEGFDPVGIRWHFLSDEGRTWLEQFETGRAHVCPIKTAVRRWVYRFAPGIYVKQVRYQGLRALGKSLAGGNACREGANFQQLERRGIAVAEVLAYGSERHFGVLKRDVLITKEVAAEHSLWQFMQDVYPALEPQTKRRLASALADFVRQLHDRGVIQRDLHVDNLLVCQMDGDYRFVLLDAQRISLRKRSLSRTQRLLNLAVLLCNFWRLASTAQCLRFLRDYGLSWNGAQGRSHLYLIKRLALKLSRHSWDAHARRALGNNARFIAERRDGFTIHRTRRDDVDEMLGALLSDPDRLLDQGKTDGNRTIGAVQVKLDGPWTFLQGYRYQGWRSRLWNARQGGQARRVWLNLWSLRTRHVPVLEPLLCMDRQCFRLPERCYLVSEYVADARPLSSCWQDLDATQRRDALIHLGMELGRMHRFGGIHGQLTWNNLLLTFVDARPQITLVGLDAARMLPAAGPLRCQLDIRVFLHDLDDRDPDGSHRRLFLDVWKRWSR
ncbi:MAG TPA: hypothetical protein DEO88_12575 [Syntrophobacteraceae bacterium]|nr:hypothetical protein [Syntrophobacteraceae bacterium]